MEVNEDENLAVEALGQLGNSCSMTWTCEFCDVLFFTESEYNDHVHIHGEKENAEYHCSICNETFKVKIALDAHELTHYTAEKLEYQCNVCLMWFQRLSSLKNHEKVHMSNSVKDMINREKRNAKRLPGRRGRKSSKKEPPSPAFELISSSAYSPKEASASEDESEQVIGMDEIITSNDEKITFEEPEKPSITTNGTDKRLLVDDSKPHACLFCEKKFAREKALISHMRLHDDNFEAVFLTCTKCEASFDDMTSLQNHAATCVVKAEPVAIDSDGSDDYFNPFIEKPSPKKFLSTSPTKRFKRDYSLDNDRSTLFRVSQGKYACDQCTKSFKTRQKLFRHVWIHRVKEHKCEFCNSSFYTAGKLEDHVHTFHTADTPFVCTECGKGYNTQKSLTDHKHYHMIRSRELCCPYCNKIFSSRQGFTIHQRIHTGERPYICEYCSKPFRDGATLRKHELIHTGERPFKCPICESAFNQKVVLREHIRGVHVGKAKSNVCELCKEVKTDSESLSEHLVKHSDEIRGPVAPKKRNPFIIRWAGQDSVVPKKKPTIVINKKGLHKKGRPAKVTTVKPSVTSDHPVKKKSPVIKNKKNVGRKRQRNSKVPKQIEPVRKSTRERKYNQGFSNYIQEDLDLLLELSKEDENKKDRSRKISSNAVENSTPKLPRVKIQKSSAAKKRKGPSKKQVSVTKRKRKPVARRYNSSEDMENGDLSDHDSIDDPKIQVKSTIIVGARSNEVEYPPILNFTEVCAMCNERFSSREDLLTHVTVHI